MAGDPTLHRTALLSRPAARPKDARAPVEETIRIVSAWIERARERRCLATLSDHSLKDIGISRYDALHEARKPFWRS